jgi:hypothetical protein
LLERNGWKNLVDMRGGLSGEPGERGWVQVGLPLERETPECSWAELRAQAGR